MLFLICPPSSRFGCTDCIRSKHFMDHSQSELHLSKVVHTIGLPSRRIAQFNHLSNREFTLLRKVYDLQVS